MDTSLLIAILSGCIALFSVALNFITARRMENLKFRFQEQLLEKNARRDYEYEARKKLYTEYEPIFFKLSELSEGALTRVKSLARTSREGKLSPGAGWLSADGYYMRSTIYLLFTPLAAYRLMREKINLVDLRVDSSISMQYVLAKLINRFFSCDFEFAAYDPSIDYAATTATMNSEKGSSRPQKYWRQGIAIGELDQFVETLIKEENGVKKILDFGEFNDHLDVEGSVQRKRYDLIRYLFTDFRPDLRPVLWRTLIAQAAIYYVISKSRFANIDFSIPEIEKYLGEYEKKYAEKFKYHHSETAVTEFEPSEVPFSIARHHILKNLHSFFEQRN